MTGQTQPRLHLGPVMASMQHPPPEHSDSLSLQAAEEGTRFEPPRRSTVGELRKSFPAQRDVFVDVRLNDWMLSQRQQFFHRGLLCANELGKEAALGEKLVNHDRADWIGLLVRLEVYEIVWHGPPHAHRLVRLAGV